MSTSTAGPPPRDDAGDTLVELLAAIAILGIGVVALVTALATMAKTSVANRSDARAETVLLSAAEYVKVMTLTTANYASCGPTPAALTTSQVDIPSGFSASYGQGSAVGSAPCSSMIQIPVTVTGDGFTLSLSVVRRA